MTNVSYSQAGSYSVLVANTLSATNSSNAVLTVNPPPTCITTPLGLISWWPAESNANDLAGLNNGSLMERGILWFGRGGDKCFCVQRESINM